MEQLTEDEIYQQLTTFNLFPHSNQSLKVMTENDEGGHFDKEEIKHLIFLLQWYIKEPDTTNLSQQGEQC